MPRGDRCDLLENFYLCGIKYNNMRKMLVWISVVICLKISIFVVSNTTRCFSSKGHHRCDLLENFYLCGIKYNKNTFLQSYNPVVICLKISIFVVSNTTDYGKRIYQFCCDLLENFYLCGIKYNPNAVAGKAE